MSGRGTGCGAWGSDMTRDARSRHATIATVRFTLDETFARLDTWCTSAQELLFRRPSYPGAWTVAEHLEHVSLVNHFLLLTIGKGVATAVSRARTQPVPAGETELSPLSPIADPGAFPWEPPDHMLPTGAMAIPEVRDRLDAQHRECHALLQRMPEGEGALCCFSMSVYRLGRIDMYQWLYFLAQHGRWHLEFLSRRDAAAGSEPGPPAKCP